MLTIRDALQTARQRLTVDPDPPGLDAQVLLCAVLGVERAHLFTHPEQTLTADQQRQFDAFLTRRAAGEPVAYLVGRRGFYDLEFIVTPDVLIPRPETEHLVEQALAYLAVNPSAQVVDVGTGSGAIAVTVAAHAPAATIYAVDISAAAVNIARRNAEANRVADRITFFEGDLLTPLIERHLKVDAVLANLPYIASDVLPTLAVSKHEPHLALAGGGDGLVLVRQLLAQMPSVCRPGALALLEIGADQGAASLALARSNLNLTSAEVLPDYAGHDRLLQLRLA